MAALDQRELFSGPEPEDDPDGGTRGQERSRPKQSVKKTAKKKKRKKRTRPAPTDFGGLSRAAPATVADILDGVTDAQRMAIEHEDGPMLVLAGAGSGKTRVITRRVARLIQKGVPPWSILSITFTNKAAGEMAERVRSLVGAERVWVSTFHSFCARLLRQDIVTLGYPREFTIYDEEDAEKCVKDALAEVRAPDSMRPGRVRHQVSRWKSALVGPDEAYSISSSPDSGGYLMRTMAEAYRVYERLVRERGALDFDDLLLKALELLRVHAEVREKWTRRFGYLQVDEYQDTNRIQYELVRILAGERRNVTVVGDPNQSIYSWRGAEPKNISDFCDDFRDARIVKLDTNFRSKQGILDAASALMEGTDGPTAGRLEGVRGEGGRPKLLFTFDETHEAQEICRRIDDSLRAGRPGRELAVFYRTNAQSRAFEQAFMQRGVPFVVVGAVAFFRRREVKDALAYLRVAMNRADDVGFRRIVNTPRRGIGNTALAKLADAASARGMSLADAAHDPSLREHAGPRPAKSLAELDALLGRLAELTKGPAGPAVRAAVEATGLRQMYEKSLEEDRAENLDELTAAAEGYDSLRPGPAGDADAQPDTEPGAARGLAGFLEEAALVSDFDRWDDTHERVALMTLHSAKGLEFPCVFVAGLEDGLLPHIRVIAEGDERGFEEERRLLYVGMTRAEDELTLSCARSRRRGGRGALGLRSRFLNDIPGEMLDVEDLTGDDGGDDETASDHETWKSRARPGEQRRFRRRASKDEFPVEDIPPDEDSALERREIRKALDAAESFDPVYEVELGERVRHPSFGVGKIVAIKGHGERTKVTIEFPGLGKKTVALGFTQLSRA